MMDRIDETLLRLGRDTRGTLMAALFGKTQEERIRAYEQLGVRMGNHVHLDCAVWLDPPFARLITVEDHVVLSAFVKLVAHDSALCNIVGFPVRRGEIRLEKNCYLGNSAVVLPGVTVGSGAIVGAGSVVTRSVPPGEVWAGNPARKVEDLMGLVDKHLDRLKQDPGGYLHVDSAYLPAGDPRFPRATPARDCTDGRVTDPGILDLLLDLAGLQPAMSVLDIGCGNGELLGRCCARGLSRVRGIDYRPSAVRAACDALGIDFVFSAMDFKALRRDFGTFDRIFLSDVTGGLQDWERSLLFILIEELIHPESRIVLYEPGRIPEKAFADFEIASFHPLPGGGTIRVLKTRGKPH